MPILFISMVFVWSATWATGTCTLGLAPTLAASFLKMSRLQSDAHEEACQTAFFSPVHHHLHDLQNPLAWQTSNQVSHPPKLDLSIVSTTGGLGRRTVRKRPQSLYEPTIPGSFPNVKKNGANASLTFKNDSKLWHPSLTTKPLTLLQKTASQISQCVSLSTSPAAATLNSWKQLKFLGQLKFNITQILHSFFIFFVASFKLL